MASIPVCRWAAVPAEAFDEDTFQSASSVPQHPAVEAGTYLWLDETDQDFFSGLHSDEQTLLLGLTGLDALDFSGLTDQF